MKKFKVVVHYSIEGGSPAVDMKSMQSHSKELLAEKLIKDYAKYQPFGSVTINID
jgi:hypothetical protein